ncbi:MAG TPA: NAD(+)/NADH kinase, partial [Ottowia beijingensis]|nr:NAD(+)/NADH kinase [Ottowia beijingensis]
MSLQFHRVALVGKYQDSASSAVPDSTREIIAEIAGFLTAQGCQVVLAERTAHSTGLDQYPALDVATIGNECDLAVVVGGDGTMLGIGRQLARYGTPLIGINQGRLGFITDIPLEGYH